MDLSSVRNKTMTDDVCAKYKGLAELPIIQGGRILSVQRQDQGGGRIKNEITCSATWTQKDLEMNMSRTFERFFFLNHEVGDLEKSHELERMVSPFVNELHNVFAQTYSTDGHRKAILRSMECNGVENQHLEIWSDSRLVMSMNLTALDRHGKVHQKGPFASFHWSDDDKLLYVAEKTMAPVSSYFDNSTPKQSPNGRGKKFIYQEDWGEQMGNQSNPVIVIVDIQTKEITILDQIPFDISPGQAVWGPDNSVLFIGWQNSLGRFGLFYGETRESALYCVSVVGNGERCHKLSDSRCCVAYPRLSPDKDKVIYAQVRLNGPHRYYEKIMMYDFSSNTNSILCEDVSPGFTTQYKKLPLYILPIASRCWLKGIKNTYVAFDTYHGVSKCTVLVCTETKQRWIVKLPSGMGSQLLLDTLEDYILLKSDSLSSPPGLYLTSVDEQISSLKRQGIYPSSVKLDKMLTGRDHSYDNTVTMLDESIERIVVNISLEGHLLPSLLLRPRGHPREAKMPMIAWIHGGPHMLYPDTFNLYPTAFCSLGFNVLFVNYRGTVGLDEKSLMSLIGRIGDQDIRDCKTIIDHVVNAFNIDTNQLFAYGGSHGGFIIAHLIAKYPYLFRAVVARNAPINLASMVDASDISDWCFRESGITMEQFPIPTREHYHKLLDLSPILKIRNMKTPLLMCVGKKDTRIQPFHAKNLSRLLNILGRRSQILLYDDGHPLSDIEVEADMFINSFAWFQRHSKECKHPTHVLQDG